MLSKNQIKLIKSLHQKKYRTKNNLFIVEGVKGVNEFLNSHFSLEKLFCTENFSNQLDSEIVEVISAVELKKISNLNSPNEVLGIFKIPKPKKQDLEKFSIVLDEINDPGNLGTIIRLCDWFGVEQLICSENTVDCYNSKVVQSTMGSLSRVSIIYTDIKQFIKYSNLPIYAAMMNGENVYKASLPENGILVMGNEANGISSEVSELITNKIAIPKFGKTQLTESLNVATATAILLSEFKRS
ncbi:TrmH family RNA methyltransferase [Urechidicola vernalis]|uniref:RNA methyltransferase n=1 Tax=Urechidicola vernalis TaxID=3075600 RepID=A0ABU2Y4Y0_9FLAO|nr:RNA methyltransferase [Urechidicola sp. P050]MDT0553248.1 RNA methyltransferase [Urechidicola sp. P050]